MTRIDDRALTELIVESQDLQADTLRQASATLPVLTEIGRDRAGVLPAPAQLEGFNTSRRDLLGRLGLNGLVARGVVGGGIAALVAGVLAKPARADKTLDTQILQTASSLEILAVATYGAALQLPFIAGGNAVVKTFATTTMSQHDQHRQAFQAQTQALGGAVQTNPNPKYAPVVEQMKPNLRAPLDVVGLAATLEQVATETYLADLPMFADVRSRTIMASVMGVESQHLATLRAVQALLQANAPQLIAIPVDVSMLPGIAGSVAFPTPFAGTGKASPPAEGAVK